MSDEGEIAGARTTFQGALAPERSAGASVGPAEVRKHCVVDGAGRSLLRAAMPAHQSGLAGERAGVSQDIEAGTDDRRCFTAFRTGLAGSARIEVPHIAEAIQYRPRRML